MLLTENYNQHRSVPIWFSLMRIVMNLTIFLSLLLATQMSSNELEEVAVGTLCLLWGIGPVLWQKGRNNASPGERPIAFMDLALCVIMTIVFRILPINATPIAFLLPILEFGLLYGIAGAIFVIAAFAWTAMLTGLFAVSSIQQPLWWVVVLLWTALMIFTAALQMAHLHRLKLSSFFFYPQKERMIKPSEAVALQKPEPVIDSMVDRLALAPQIVVALELPFHNMGVRTEDYRQKIERAANALCCISDFDTQAISDCLQELLYAARQNWTSLAVFSPREREILELLLQNISYKEMSNRLYVSTSTIKTHVYHIFQKLGISNREEAISLIRERGWFSASEYDALPTHK